MEANYFTLTPDRENELIEQIAKFVAKSEIRDVMKMLLNTYGLTNIFGNIGFMMTYPFAVGLLGDFGQDFSQLVGLNPVGSSQRIIKRVEELEREYEEHPEKKNDEANLDRDKAGWRSMFGRLKSLFGIHS